MIALLFLLAAPVDAQAVLQMVLASDPWGFSDAEVVTHAVMNDRHGSTSELRFSALSRRYDPPLSKTIARLLEPADLAGTGFLQTQRRDADDDRWLFLPELKRSRRISGALRTSSFLGTDMSFAEIDRRDLRDGKPALNGEETLAARPCWRLIITGTRGDSEYSKIELWVRQDNGLPVLWKMYDRSNQLFKTLAAEEVQRVGGRWFITRSRMTNLREQHQTLWILEQVTPRADISDDEFTLRNLEKM